MNVLEGFRLSRCGSCSSSIVWALTPAGKAMPVDPEPHPDGNVELTRVGRTPYDVIRAKVLGPLERLLVDGPLYHTHFTTCPDGESWSR